MTSGKTKDNFQLNKWYLDVIDEKGDTIIFYMANLRWKKLNLYYYNRLSCTAAGGTSNKVMLRRVPSPEWNGTVLRWKNGTEAAEWRSLTAPVREALLQTAAGDIDWDCLLPNARVTVTDGEVKMEGLGYAERLNMTLLPWKFAIEELYWGRFLSDEHHITWIEWRGPIPKFLVFYNSSRYQSGVVSETEIAFDGFRLLFSEVQVLRKGSLWHTLFSRFPWLKHLFPLKILLTDECKWRSKGTLFAGDKELATGWSIYEKVIWK